MADESKTTVSDPVMTTDTDKNDKKKKSKEDTFTPTVEKEIEQKIHDQDYIMDQLKKNILLLPLVVQELARKGTDIQLLNAVVKAYGTKVINKMYKSNYPIFHAFWNQNDTMIVGLMEHGANFLHRNGRGESILSMLIKKKLPNDVYEPYEKLYNTVVSEQQSKQPPNNNRDRFVKITDDIDPLGDFEKLNHHQLAQIASSMKLKANGGDAFAKYEYKLTLEYIGGHHTIKK